MDRGFLGSGYEGIFGASADPFTEVGHCLISLVLATAGGFAAHFLFGTPSDAATARELSRCWDPVRKVHGCPRPPSWVWWGPCWHCASRSSVSG